MPPDTDFRPAVYVVIVLGAALAFFAAVVPHFGAGYRLDVALLLAGLSPYLVYGMLTEFLRGRSLPALGAGLLAVEFFIRVPLRLLHDGYPDGLAYAVPPVAAGVLAVVLALAMRGQGGAPPPPPPPEPESG